MRPNQIFACGRLMGPRRGGLLHTLHVGSASRSNRGPDRPSAFAFAPYRRSTVGFDRLFDMLENSSFGQGQENYPPFDLIKTGDNQYRIELAVAGFKPDELDITAQQNVLIVSGRKNEETEQKSSDYIYRGIANRSFERRFALADHIQVRGADMKDGLLV